GAGAHLHAHDAADRVEGEAQARPGVPSSSLSSFLGGFSSIFEEERLLLLLFSVGSGKGVVMTFASHGGSRVDLGADAVDDCEIGLVAVGGDEKALVVLFMVAVLS